MALACLISWLYRGPIMHLLEIHMDTPTWWPYRAEELDSQEPDANRPPQLDICRLSGRDGCACFSSRESAGNDDNDDDSVTAVESYHEEDSDVWIPDTPEVQAVRSATMAFLHHGPALDDLDTRHDREELTDSMQVCASGSPTDSFMIESGTISPSIFGMDMVQDHLEDMSFGLEPTHIPLYIPHTTEVNTMFVLRCKHVHSEKCFEEY